MIPQALNKIKNLLLSIVPQWLIVSCSFSISLLLIRIAVTRDSDYMFLYWNLFLAFIPYAISSVLLRNASIIASKWRLAIATAAWLLFIPNTFYILTDLFHLDKVSSAPKWFDLLLLLSFSWNGLLFGVLSIRRMEMVIYNISGRSFSLLAVFAIMWLNAFGIYIGRYLRYNSWDVITQPVSLFGEMLHLIFNPFDNKMEWGMIAGYAGFMTLLYIAIKKLAAQFHLSNHNPIDQHQ